MKLALIFFSVLTSLSTWFGAQGTPPPSVCRGKSLPITLIPGPPMTYVTVPLRFGGTRPPPLPWVNSFPSTEGFRLVIRNRDEFSDFWKRLTARAEPSGWVPPLPEIDFSKEIIVVAAMGTRPTSGYGIIIDGVCEANGQVEVFVTSYDNAACSMQLQVVTAPADAVRLPRTDLPIVFRETQVSCKERLNQLQPLK